MAQYNDFLPRLAKYTGLMMCIHRDLAELELAFQTQDEETTSPCDTRLQVILHLGLCMKNVTSLATTPVHNVTAKAKANCRMLFFTQMWGTR